MTNKEKFEVIGSVFATVDHEAKDEILEFVQAQIESIEKRNAKAKETASKKRAEGDALRDTIEEMLGDEPMTINDILEALNDDALTSAKVVARMSQLVKAGKAEKVTVKADGRKLVAYTAVAAN